MTIVDYAQVLTQGVIAVCVLANFVISMHNGISIKAVEKQTNHIKDELVAEVRKSSFAAGQKQQQQQDPDVH